MPREREPTMMRLIRFHLKKFQAEVVIPERNLMVQTWESPEFNGLLIRLVRYVAYIRGEDTLRIEIPASWWQHLKQALFAKRWCPAWIKRRWPVRYEVTVYFAEAMFPSLEMPDDQFAVEFYNWSPQTERP